MTQEEKQLLFIDLCGRLLYGVILDVDNGKYREDKKIWPGLFYSYNLWDAKPYLRPMSSMTEEERNNLRAYCRTQEGIIYDIGVAGAINSVAIIDFLNAHHFDYRGLIEKGLALEAPDGMYNVSQKWTPLRSGLKENEDGQIVGGVKL